MKKVLALALALVLAMSMATVAFASVAIIDPAVIANDAFAPGTTVKVFSDSFITNGDTDENAYFTSEYFTLSYKIDKGADLLDSIKFNGDGAIEIKFKSNYALEQKAIANFAIKEINLKAIKDIAANQIGTAAAISKNDTFTVLAAATAAVYEAKYIGYVATETTLDSATAVKVSAAGYYKFKAGTVSYKDITIDLDEVYAEARVFDGQGMYLGTDKTPNLDIVKANPDASIDFVAFKGAPTFSQSAKVEISADKGDFLYELKDGKLVATNFKWDDASYVFAGKTTTLGSYVISDVELKNVAATEEDVKNPNTGANDVVGVAVALAVVSLVAAGAVSLKK